MVADDLTVFLANTYALYLKTQQFHWNVSGALFRDLHLLFEEQYDELAAAVDVVAERISALHRRVPGSFSEFGTLATIEEATQEVSAQEMLHVLAQDHAYLAGKARLHIEVFSDKKDFASADLLTARLRAHEKASWMLRNLSAKNA